MKITKLLRIFCYLFSNLLFVHAYSMHHFISHGETDVQTTYHHASGCETGNDDMPGSTCVDTIRTVSVHTYIIDITPPVLIPSDKFSISLDSPSDHTELRPLPLGPPPLDEILSARIGSILRLE